MTDDVDKSKERKTFLQNNLSIRIRIAREILKNLGLSEEQINSINIQEDEVTVKTREDEVTVKTRENLLKLAEKAAKYAISQTPHLDRRANIIPLRHGYKDLIMDIVSHYETGNKPDKAAGYRKLRTALRKRNAETLYVQAINAINSAAESLSLATATTQAEQDQKPSTLQKAANTWSKINHNYLFIGAVATLSAIAFVVGGWVIAGAVLAAYAGIKIADNVVATFGEDIDIERTLTTTIATIALAPISLTSKAITYSKDVILNELMEKRLGINRSVNTIHDMIRHTIVSYNQRSVKEAQEQEQQKSDKVAPLTAEFPPPSAPPLSQASPQPAVFKPKTPRLSRSERRLQNKEDQDTARGQG